MIVCKLPKSCAILFAAFSLIFISGFSGCGRASLKISDCMNNVPTYEFHCSTYDNKPFKMPFYKTENYVCMSPIDIGQLLRQCASNREKKITSPIDVEVCVSDPQSNGMQCAFRDGTDGYLVYGKTDKYTCFTPKDFGLLLKHCRISAEG